MTLCELSVCNMKHGCHPMGKKPKCFTCLNIFNVEATGFVRNQLCAYVTVFFRPSVFEAEIEPCSKFQTSLLICITVQNFYKQKCTDPKTWSLAIVRCFIWFLLFLKFGQSIETSGSND